ncbi:hypothetical protein [Fodinibius saliphilus]|uniref:hypothetical protein n=1 Tax=Fodinibius saliphilus TaxID=1920650 RepID=UPI001109A787|nr:hypothetical protein [Fodinibius saliphilus]
MDKNFNNVLRKAQNNWMNIKDVISVAEGLQDKKRCIDVYLANQNEKVKEQIPTEYKGYKVVFRDSGGPFKSQ